MQIGNESLRMRKSQFLLVAKPYDRIESDLNSMEVIMATTKYSDLSYHVEPNGIVKFNETLVTDEYTISASAETDKHGSLVNGKWTHTDDKGTALSVTFPDGKMEGRNAPSDPEQREGLIEDRGELLMRKTRDCKTASSMNLL
jgi:hypothetical protein